MNLHFARARAQISSNQRVAPAIIRVEVPWSARRESLSEKDRVSKIVKGILNKLTLEKFDVLKRQLIDSGKTIADIFKVQLRLNHVQDFIPRFWGFGNLFNLVHMFKRIANIQGRIPVGFEPQH